ncbi:MAG: CHC2 zinc finger domain-containing protein [Paraclostridium sp.]
MTNANVQDIFNTFGLDLKNRKTICPYHEEKTPSCHVYQSDIDNKYSNFYCFGCGEYGDIYQLLKHKLNSNSYFELRNLLGIKSEGYYSKSNNDHLYAAFSDITRDLVCFDSEDLSHRKIKKYLNDRLITDKIIEERNLGFINSYSITSIINKHNLFYNISSDSVFIPFLDENRRISYGVVKSITDGYRYPYNVPKKGYVLFKSLNAIESLVLCEGQFDAMLLFDRYKNSKILSFGGNNIKLSVKYIEAFLRELLETSCVSKQIIICPDVDKTGDKICFNLITEILQNKILGYFNIRILTWTSKTGYIYKDYNDALLGDECTFEELDFVQWIVIKLKIGNRLDYIDYINSVKELIHNRAGALLFCEKYINKEITLINTNAKYKTLDYLIENTEEKGDKISLFNPHLDDILDIRENTGTYITLCGLSGAGKSRTVINTISNFINFYKTKKIILLSLDMDKNKFANEIIAQHEFSFKRKPSQEDLKNIIIPECESSDIDDIIGVLDGIIEMDELVKFIFIDNLDNITSLKKDTYPHESYVSERLAILTKNRKVIVFLLVQNNKETIKYKSPNSLLNLNMGSFKGSIGIRSHCDIMIGITLEEIQNFGFYIFFKILKNRYGRSDPDLNMKNIKFGQAQKLNGGFLEKNIFLDNFQLNNETYDFEE